MPSSSTICAVNVTAEERYRLS